MDIKEAINLDPSWCFYFLKEVFNQNGISYRE